MMRKVALIALLPAALAAPTPVPVALPTPYAAGVVAPAPAPTQPPELRRGLGDDLDSIGSAFESFGGAVESFVGSLYTDVASDVSAFVGSGLLDFPTGFPTGTAVEKSLGISDSDLNAEPTQVLNLPAYGNWTTAGWNVRVHGNVYKVPNISESKIDDLANVFIIGKDIDDLNSTEKAQARNLTRSIFVVQQGDEVVTMKFIDNASVSSNDTGGALNATGGSQTLTLPYNTTFEGDFDTFVHLKNISGPHGTHLIPGNGTDFVQVLDMYANGTDSGNATVYLVPDNGITVISDIDDILRVTKIYEPSEGLLNTFVRPFTQWMNMPDIYANWSSSLPELHFHYLTTTPEQATRNYMDFIYKTYPLGSFDTRPLNFSDLSETLSVRKFLLDKIFQTFPDRKFVLVADTSNSDVMKDYPAMYTDYPGQVACIFLRNTSSTDSGDKFPYDTSGFKDIPQQHYMFFNVPDDLTNLDIANSMCYNSSIKQNVTFSEQGLPFGLSDESAGPRYQVSVVSVVVTVVAVAMIAVLS